MKPLFTCEETVRKYQYLYNEVFFLLLAHAPVRLESTGLIGGGGA